MIDKLKGAATEGLVLAVKYGVVMLVVGALFLLMAGDYKAVRTGAQQGAAAFLYIQQQLTAAQKAASPTPAK